MTGGSRPTRAERLCRFCGLKSCVRFVFVGYLELLINLFNAHPTWLELAHKKLDEAVFATYGWLKNKETIMSTTTLYRLSALAGILSGVCIITGRLLAGLPNTLPGEIFDVLSPFFALFLSIGLYLRQRKESGAFGGIAFILLFSGLVMLVSLDYYGTFIRFYLPDETIGLIEEGPSAPVFVGNLLTFLIGEILFGISVIRTRIYSKIAAILFMIGLIFVVLHPTGVFPEGAVDIGATATGIGLIWWSIDLNKLASTKVE